MRSQRFFWWSADQLSHPWRPLCLVGIRGGDENCNRTIGFRLPGGMLFACLNIPLRQEPCGMHADTIQCDETGKPTICDCPDGQSGPCGGKGWCRT